MPPPHLHLTTKAATIARAAALPPPPSTLAGLPRSPKHARLKNVLLCPASLPLRHPLHAATAALASQAKPQPPDQHSLRRRPAKELFSLGQHPAAQSGSLLRLSSHRCSPSGPTPHSPLSTSTQPQNCRPHSSLSRGALQKQSAVLARPAPPPNSPQQQEQQQQQQHPQPFPQPLTRVQNPARLTSIDSSSVGVKSAQGRKSVNEDRFVVCQILPNTLMVGVLDGHGGTQAVEFAAQHLASSIVPDPHTGLIGPQQLIEAFHHVDAMFFKRFGPQPLPSASATAAEASMVQSGTTAVVALIYNMTHLLLAHVGDSRALLCHKGRSITLTEDHKPNRTDEYARIHLSGGSIEGYSVPRVMGRLAMTRAIGDPHLKQQGVISTPDVIARVLGQDDSFLVIGSDGLFDVMSNEEIIDAVQHQATSVEDAADLLVNLAISYGSNDDITVAVVRLHGWDSFTKDLQPGQGIRIVSRNMTRRSN